MELPRFKDPQEANIFFLKKFTLYYNTYCAIIDLITDELERLGDNPSRFLADYFFMGLWNNLIDSGLPEDLSTKEYSARDVLLVKLMNDLKKEVTYDE
jgi:hypothetical protein